VLTVVFDAAPLITACKFTAHDTLVIDHLLVGCRIMIAPSVEEEVAVLGASYPDGEVAGECIAQGRIQVVPVAERRWARHLAEYALGDGERDTIELCGQIADIEALVTDDYLAFVAATRQGLTAWMLPDLVVELAAHGALAIEVAESVLTAIRSRYRVGVIEHSRVRLQEVKQHAESRCPCEGGNSAGCRASQGGGSK
jgi:predicted nucleic acid-binding protein